MRMAGTEIFGAEEINAVTDVIERKMIHRYGSHAVRNGIYRTEEFEEKAKGITGSKYALAVSNGTAALIVALKGLGVGPGDEVITSPFTFIATIEAIVACGAVPVLGEIDGTLGLDPVSAEKLITERTKALMPVHMFGAAADLDAFICQMLYELAVSKKRLGRHLGLKSVHKQIVRGFCTSLRGAPGTVEDYVIRFVQIVKFSWVRAEPEPQRAAS